MDLLKVTGSFRLLISRLFWVGILCTLRFGFLVDMNWEDGQRSVSTRGFFEGSGISWGCGNLYLFIQCFHFTSLTFLVCEVASSCYITRMY